MNNKIRILKNASWIIISRIVQSFLSMIVTMLTARYLGPSNFGSINYAASIVAFASPLLHLGLTSIIVQEIVSKPEKEGEILGSSIFACSLSSIFCLFGIYSFLMIANRGETETIIVCLLYSILLLVQIFDVIQYWFQAKLLSKYTSIVSLIAYIIVSAYKIFLLVTNKNIYWFAISNALDYLIIALLSYFLYKKLGGKKFHISKKILFSMLNKSKYYIISGLMITVFAQTDRVMLKIMINDSATGYYSAAVTCASMTSFIFGAIIDSFRPVIFQSVKSCKEAFQNNIKRLYSIIIYFSLIQCIMISLFSKYIILILYGNDYFPAVNALRIIVWYTTFSYLGSVRNIWMLAENKQKMIWKIDLLGAIANVILNYLLIPNFGILGAATASLLTQVFTNVIIVGIFKETRINIKFMIESLSPRILMNLLKVK